MEDTRVKINFRQHIHFFVFFICVFNFVIRLPFAEIPAFRDEIVYLHRVEDLVKSGLNPFVESWGYKPPVTHILPALITLYSFPSQIWGRLEIYLLSSVTLYFTYKFGERFFSKKIGFLGMICLFFYPMFIAQSFIFQDAIPFTAFFIMSLYFYFLQKGKLYALFSSLLVMTKETGIILVGLIFCYEFLLSTRINYTSNTKAYVKFYLFIPLGIFFIWIVLNKYILGWYFWPDYVSQFNLQNIAILLSDGALQRNFQEIYLNYFLWPISVVFFFTAIVCKLFMRYEKHFVKQIIYKYSFIFFIYVLFHFFGQVGPRYFLFLVPIMFIIALNTINYFIPRLTFSIAAVCILGFISFNTLTVIRFPPNIDIESSMAFLKSIELTQKTVQKITTSYPNAFILSSGPFINDQLTNPLFGYVTSSFPNIDVRCDQLKDNTFLNIFFREHSNATIFYLIEPFNPKCGIPDNLEYIESFCHYRNLESEYCYHLTRIVPISNDYPIQ